VTYRIVFTPAALHTFEAIADRRIREQIRNRINGLAHDPEQQGKPLSGELAGCRSLRAAGQRFRIVYRVERARVLVLVLAVLDAVTLPLQNAVSRVFERQADRTSLELTEDPAAFIRGEVTLARTNLADVAPPRPMVWLLYTHPPVLERIAAAEAYVRGGR